jgi:hemoglobin-like flavoprotein
MDIGSPLIALWLDNAGRAEVVRQNDWCVTALPLETAFSGEISLVPRPMSNMTPDQIRLVRSSWSMIAERANVFTARFYDHLFMIDDSAARLFTGVEMTVQQWKLAQTLGVVVQVLDNLDSFLPAVAALGERHSRYDVRPGHFETVGQALLEAFADTLGDRFTPQIRAAWTAAYDLIASVMQQALMKSTRPPLRLA